MSAVSQRLPGGIYISRHDACPPPVGEIGGKAFGLLGLDQVLRRLDRRAEVPRWMLLPPAFVTRLLCTEPGEAAAARADLQARMSECGWANVRLAVRSSAVGEDGATASFAGQFETVLGIRCPGSESDPEHELLDAIRRVSRSVHSPRVREYARRQTDDSPPRAMAVILQEMVDAVASGVAFTADPVSGSRSVVVINSVLGLGEGLVSGELDGDVFRVSTLPGESTSVEQAVAAKPKMLRLSERGTPEWVSVPADLQNVASLTEYEAGEIAALARAVEGAFGSPQDIEWAMAETTPGQRSVFVLQTRPITTLRTKTQTSAAPPAEGERRIWDNSNIIESYHGVTTPLTFSFARAAYERVYHQFFALMGVPGDVLLAHRTTFAGMIGLVRGRIYYNLLNWYRALSLLPGYQLNRQFMERMMGVKEPLVEEPPAAPNPPKAASRLQDGLRLGRTVIRMAREHRRLPGAVPRFLATVERVVGPLAGQNLGSMTHDELMALYSRLELELLDQWRTPIVNDFFAMVWFGVAGRLIERWLPVSGDSDGLLNGLISGEGGIVSTEPARWIQQAARWIRADPNLVSLFTAAEEPAEIWRRLDTEPRFAAFRRDVQTYLDRFGDRCLNELKLESIPLSSDPTFLIRQLRGAALRAGEAQPPATEPRLRAESEAQVRARLSPVQRRVFGWVLSQTRSRIRDRENLRFERTRVFGLARRIFLAIGCRLAEQRRLDQARDVFYLTREELVGYTNGTGCAPDLAAVARSRRQQFREYAEGPAPPDRFETVGPPSEYRPATCSEETWAQTGLQGSGCCPGTVRARACVVRDPESAADVAGRILVAERTDPGWAMLFPAAAGVLVQRGSLLSHSAIVARELGIPCIVSVSGLLDSVQDGQWLEMDGAAGTIRVMGFSDRTAASGG